MLELSDVPLFDDNARPRLIEWACPMDVTRSRRRLMALPIFGPNTLNYPEAAFVRRSSGCKEVLR